MSENQTVAPEKPREGWQAEGSYTQKRWHFIIGSESLCRKFGFYFGAIVPGGMTVSESPSDCAECKRRVVRELAKREAAKELES